MLTILLKLIIHLEKEAEVLKEAVLPLLYQEQKPILDILAKQFPDPCPENRIYVCKCIYRYSRTYKHLLTEDQITDLSHVIVYNFNHQRASVRELSMQAFTYLHLCDQSKSISQFYPALMNFLLPDIRNCDILLESTYRLLTEHIDRHIYAPMLSIPFIANLQTEEYYKYFEQIGTRYVEENQKYDKFLQIYAEMQGTSQATHEALHKNDAIIQQFSGCKHFTRYLNAGCRVIAYMSLNNNIKVLIDEMVALQTNQALQDMLVQLVKNLILINQSHIIKFTQVFISKLTRLIQNNKYDEIVMLIIYFIPFDELISFVAHQVDQLFNYQKLTVNSCSGLISFYKFVEKTIRALENTDQINLVVCKALHKDANFIEDSAFMYAYTDLLVEITGQKLQYSNEAINKIICALGAIGAHKESCPTMNNKTDTSMFRPFIYYNWYYLDLALIDYQLDINQQSNQLVKTTVLSQILHLTCDTDFHKTYKSQLIQALLRLLRQAANYERLDGSTRYGALQCGLLLIYQLNLDHDEMELIFDGLFKASTWRHSARNPECLVAVEYCLAALTYRAISFYYQISKATLDQILSKITVNLESDELMVRGQTLYLCQQFIYFFKEGTWQNSAPYDFGELQYALVQRLDDAKTSITLYALEQFDYLTEIVGAIQVQKYNITHLILIHLSDGIEDIRNHTWSVFQKHINKFDKDIVKSEMQGKLFEYFDLEGAVAKMPESDHSWVQEREKMKREVEMPEEETTVLRNVKPDALDPTYHE